MHKLIFLVFIATWVNCQLTPETADNPSKPTRFVLPYAFDEEESAKEEQYYKPARRSEQVPTYQYEDDEEYYRPRPQTEQYRYQAQKQQEPEPGRFQQSTRLRASRKQRPLEAPQGQQAVEQYLKEVNPTTKTNYQRPAQYLRFTKQDAIVDDQPKPIRYVLQPEKPYDASQQAVGEPKPAQKAQPFNLVAYQNALNAQQRLLAAEQQDAQPQQDALSKSSIYVHQSVAKKPSKKQKSRTTTTEAPDQFDYYPQRQAYQEAVSSPVLRYQPRVVYKQEASYQVEDPGSDETPRTKVRTRPTKKSKVEEAEEYQPAVKYQKEQQYEEQYEEASKYQEEPVTYRSARPDKVKYSQPIEEASEARAEGYTRYQTRRPTQLYQEVRPRQYLRQFQEESQQVQRYHPDLSYQPSSEVAQYRPRGSFVSYSQDLPNSSVRYHRNLNLEGATSYVE